jgi:hypothetical protein
METVTVGCKLPHGLICETGESPSKVIVTLKGVDRVTGAPGMTENVDKVAISAWFKRNEKLEFVKNGLVFMGEKTTNVIAQGKELSKEKHGLEPLDPKAAPKGVKPFSKHS